MHGLVEPLPDDASDRVGDLVDAQLCDACLGRTVARLGYGLTNAERGRQLRGEARVDPAECSLCDGLVDEADRVAELALAAVDGVDHATFQLGCRVDADLETAEEALWDDHDLAETAEPLRSELTREAGKVFEAEAPSTFDPDDPDVALIVDTRFWAVEPEISPIFVRGRYRKLERGIPQTRWDCRRCQGQGCVACDMTGKTYPTSVEELIAEPARERFEATEATLHGQGREDVDARMLGDGRPFVLEVSRPRRREVDLEALAGDVRAGSDGAVEVQDLEIVDRDAVAAVKEARSRKTYRAEVAFEVPVEGENLKEATAVLAGATIRQRTPSRVAHRRADRTRKRRVHRCEVVEHEGGSATIVVEGDAGLYVKELVSGDGGRTEPSLAGLVENPAEIAALDVVAVED